MLTVQVTRSVQIGRSCQRARLTFAGPNVAPTSCSTSTGCVHGASADAPASKQTSRWLSALLSQCASSTASRRSASASSRGIVERSSSHHAQPLSVLVSTAGAASRRSTPTQVKSEKPPR
jgi:hypothetical protein